MELQILSYQDLLISSNTIVLKQLENALLQTGIVGIKDVPDFKAKSQAFVQAARLFCSLNEEIKKQYTPNRDNDETEGYELGAEWFKNEKDIWQIDDKKASFYAKIPNEKHNKWPHEVDLKTPYLALGELIFQTGKIILNALGLNESSHLNHELLSGYGRLLHYQKEGAVTNGNPDWCGAHFDHGILTGLMPAYYFQQGKEIEEPAEAGLYIVPTDSQRFEKVYIPDKSILLFQVGEFGQLLSNDHIKATRHIVKKAKQGIERFAFALFYSVVDHFMICSHSSLTKDARYTDNKDQQGCITYGQWQAASLARYRALKPDIDNVHYQK